MPSRLGPVIIIATGLLSAIPTVRAESWPSHPIRAIVPVSAGSAADIVARVVFDQLSQQLGQPIVVENRPGASSTIGARVVAHSDPDGYTLLAISSAYTIAPAIVPDLGYDPVKDFVAVASLGSLPNVLVISPSKNIHTLQELVTASKTQPITFGSTGAGSPIRLAIERLRAAAKFDAKAIPFKGAPEALVEVMAGRIDVYYSAVLPALPLIRSGKLVPLAVSSRDRAISLPEVPTSLEAGYPNSDYNFWVGVFAPAQTPTAVVDKLNGEILKALATPEVRAKLANLGVQPMPMGTTQFNAYVKAEIEKDAALVKATGLSAE
ncbi:MAG TPA: tripartite tricarboxylate transporter substrate binding protein [Xanthobacteraceae bacterium]|jgi:tripartite-type tricarboxylate transporter receptor subunit TctC